MSNSNANIKTDFERLLCIEKRIFSNEFDTDIKSFWGFVRPKIFRSFTNVTPDYSLNKIHLIKQIVLSPVYIAIFLYKLFLSRAVLLVFGTDRRNNNGKCKYLEVLPSMKNKKTMLFNYTYASTPYVSNSEIALAPLVLLVKLTSFIVTILAPYKGEFVMPISKIVQIELDLNIHRQLKMMYIQYRIMRIIWRILLTLLKPKRILFVSNNFFIPIIIEAKKKKIPTYEVAHALMHPYHVSYSYPDEHKPILFLPDVLIENKYSSALDDSFFQYRRIIGCKEGLHARQEMKKINLSSLLHMAKIKALEGSANILILGQGGGVDINLSLLIAEKILQNKKYTNNSIRFRSHPAHKDTRLDLEINYSSPSASLEDDVKWSDIVIGEYSNALLDAMFMNKLVLVSSEYYFPCFKAMNCPVFQANKFFDEF